MESNTADESADRAISSVGGKLDKSLSVEYTVNQLVADATDKTASGSTRVRKLATTTGSRPQSFEPSTLDLVIDSVEFGWSDDPIWLSPRKAHSQNTAFHISFG